MGDHLFGASHLPPHPLRIEYNGPSYDGGTWRSYLSRCLDERTAAIIEEDLVNISLPVTIGPYLECWFYFGTLHAVFGDRLKDDDFIYIEQDGRRVLTTVNLRYYVDEALAKLKEKGRKNQMGEKIVFGQCSKADFESLINRSTDHLSRARVRIALRPEMLFAIHLLHTTLSNIVSKLLGKKAKLELIRSTFAGVRNEWADRQMRERGWCPNEISRFANIDSISAQAYALQLERPTGMANNMSVGNSHKTCTEDECKAKQVDEKTYRTKHTKPYCQCEPCAVPIEEVKSILNKGSIPLIRIYGSKDSYEIPKIEVLEHRLGRRYVAVSHVWSDGLGNATENALPCCQLRRLRNNVGSLLHDPANVPGALDNPLSIINTAAGNLLHKVKTHLPTTKETTIMWIDTLCVPLDHETRKKAIRGMRKVYENACRVVVLDSELMNTPSRSAPEEETMLRILLFSGWMRRLWTLQEGIAARRRLFALFQDQIINVPNMADKLAAKYEGGKFHILQNNVPWSLYMLWFAWFGQVTTALSTSEKMFDMVGPFTFMSTPCELLAMSWTNVAGRATSKDEDRPVILANIMGFDPKDILEGKSAAERMRTFYNMLHEVPQDVIFQPGKKLQEIGWAWAPETCRFRGSNQLRTGVLNFTPGKKLEEGLLTEFPGFVIKLYDIAVSRLDGFWFIGDRILTAGSRKLRSPRYVHVKMTGEQAKEACTVCDVAVVFQDYYPKVRRSLFDDREERLTCVVISVDEHKDDIIFGKYKFLAEARSLPEGELLPPVVLEMRHPSLEANRLKEKQKWCIG